NTRRSCTTKGVIRITFAIHVTNQARGRGNRRIIIAMTNPSIAAITVPTTVTTRVTLKNELSMVGRTSQAKSQRQKLVLSSMSGASTVVAKPAVSNLMFVIGHHQPSGSVQKMCAVFSEPATGDRKSTRLNSSHVSISYDV